MNVFDVPSDPAFWQDPFPFYRDALQAGSGLFSISSGGYSVLGYEALYEIGRDPRAEGHPFADGGFGPDMEDLYRLLKWGLFALGAPNHKPLRQAAIAGLSTIGADVIREHARTVAVALAGQLERRGGGDLIAGFTKPLASRVFCRVIGLPDDRSARLTEAIDSITEQLNGVPGFAVDANAGAAWLYGELAALFEIGASPLMGAIEDRLPASSGASTVDLVASFVFDAVEMVSTGLFGVLDCLMEQPALRDAIRVGAYSLKDAVQEAYRLTTPATLTSRIALEAFEWRGQRIEEGAPLMMWWGSGNLDPTVFADPTRFDPARASNRHLAFGIGGHACIGRQFGSIVTEEAARALLLDTERAPRKPGRPMLMARLVRIAEHAPITWG